MLTSALSPLPLPHLFDRVRGHVLPAEWPAFAPYVEAICGSSASATPCSWRTTIRRPEIFHGVADIVGDSLALPVRGPRRMRTSSCWPAFTSWPRPRSS